MACACVCVQVASYAFVFPNEDGVPHRMLLPLLDILNHGNEDAANVQIMEAENGDIYAYTLRDVKAGEEVGPLVTAPCMQPLCSFSAVQDSAVHMPDAEVDAPPMLDSDGMAMTVASP